MDNIEIVKNVLAHHGVKGMRWGVRRSSPPVKSVTVSQKGKKLKSTGGEGRGPHQDAIKAQTLGQIRKKSGVHALSNEELQAYQRRLNLEQSVKQLEVKQPGAKNLIKRTLTRQGGQHMNNVAQAVASKLGKAAVAAAMA
jgi:hypothetical protein